mgnify:CR=1 FL=1
MDSLSQIVLGAAVGEVVLGHRIGNRAMWSNHPRSVYYPCVKFTGSTWGLDAL